MVAAPAQQVKTSVEDSALESRLKREITGEVLFDSFSRGRYATDASSMLRGTTTPAGMIW